MTSPADEIATLLQDNSVGTRGATSGWGIFVGREPTTPDTAITLHDTPGEPASPRFSRDFPRFQVRVRGAKNGFVAADSKMDDIREILLGISGFVAAGSVVYVGIWNVIDKALLGYDDNNRPIIVTTWRAVREPPASGNRQ